MGVLIHHSPNHEWTHVLKCSLVYSVNNVKRFFSFFSIWGIMLYTKYCYFVLIVLLTAGKIFVSFSSNSINFFFFILVILFSNYDLKKLWTTVQYILYLFLMFCQILSTKIKQKYRGCVRRADILSFWKKWLSVNCYAVA